MAFVSELFDQLRDQLNDATDTQVPFATKKLYLNRGIHRLWPGIYRLVSTTIPLVQAVYDYSLAAAVADGHIVSVEVSTVTAGTEFRRFTDYDIIPGDEDLAGVFRVVRHPGDGFIVRIKYVAAIPTIAAASYAAAQSETWTGPDRAMGLPVAYAMGLITSRKIDDRQDTNRYSTTQALNGVTDQDLMAASQMWFAQFELELESQSRPLPPARD
jgi:hypothetical protein